MGVFNRLSQNHFKMSKTSRKEIFHLFTFFLQSVASQQLALGAGSGTGSCRAFPFRAAEVDWDVCPPQLPCCNEYGYCRTREEWGLQNFRDFNGASNGIELPDSVLELENALGGEPGPGLGADSDFDKRQLEKVGSGSPAQRVNPFAPAPVPVQAFSNGGGSFAAGKPPAPVPVQDFSNGGGSSAAGKAENSLLGNSTAAAAIQAEEGVHLESRPLQARLSAQGGGWLQIGDSRVIKVVRGARETRVARVVREVRGARVVREVRGARLARGARGVRHRLKGRVRRHVQPLHLGQDPLAGDQGQGR